MKNYFYCLIKLLLMINITTHCNAMALVTLWANYYIAKKHPSIQKFEPLIQEDQKLFCHDYTFLTAMEAIGQFPFISCSDWYEKYDILNACFKQTTELKAGNIVTYQDDYNSEILHSGIIYDDKNNVLSKWGAFVPYVCLHSLWDVPSPYGKKITCYEPTKTKEEMRNYIQETYQRINSSRQDISSQSQLQKYSFNEIRFYILTCIIIGLWMYEASQ